MTPSERSALVGLASELYRGTQLSTRMAVEIDDDAMKLTFTRDIGRRTVQLARRIYRPSDLALMAPSEERAKHIKKLRDELEG